MEKGAVMISVIIPMYNESEGIDILYDRLIKSAETWSEDFEVVLINDGSVDNTFELCKALTEKDPRIKLLNFTRNFGHQAAVTAGLCYASGDYIAVIDADLQDPPEELSRFINKCREGYDVVYAVRSKRKDGLFKKACAWAYYRFLSSAASINIPLDTGDFCVMSRKTLNALNALPERNRFIRGLRVWLGHSQLGLEYERSEREFGEPKYTFIKSLNFAFDGLANFSYKPLRMVMIFGVIVACIAFLLGAFYFWMYVTDTTILGHNPRQSRGWTSLILVMLYLGGAQLIGMGILGEYIGRVFEEIKGRPMYMIDQQIGFGHDEIIYPGPAFVSAYKKLHGHS
jgi:dolichol-phosphate mannosyltransferase